MKPGELQRQLVEMFGQKAALKRRHEAVARIASQYDLNNAYQYVIAREDQHLGWLADAIRGTGVSVPDVDAGPLPLTVSRGGEAVRSAVLEDANGLDAFVSAWRPRVGGVAHARHKLMLELMLGEMQEQARLLHQAASGRLDLLGRRTGGDRTPGAVLSVRWVE